MYNTPTNKLHENIASQLIKQLEQGTAPWQLPWDNQQAPISLPYNAVTGNRYKGINTLSLLLSGYQDPRWVTYKQAESQGWQVRRGEKAAPIQFRKNSEFVPLLDSAGNKVIDEKGKPKGYLVPLERPIIKTAWVFNAHQVRGIPELDQQITASLAWKPIERAEALISATRAKINHVRGDSAYYNPIADEITLPLPSQFSSPDRFYATALHEIGHWTGHESRLDRRIMNTAGSPEYAREELRAEIASLLLGHELKIGHDPGQHAAYVESWIRTLRDTPGEIIAASADAERIFDYVLDCEQLYTRELASAMIEDKVITLPPRLPLPQQELSMGDTIELHGSSYKVTGMLKRGRVRLVDTTSGMELSVSKGDSFYQTLLEASRQQSEQHSRETPPATQRDQSQGPSVDPEISR